MGVRNELGRFRYVLRYSLNDEVDEIVEDDAPPVEGDEEADQGVHAGVDHLLLRGIHGGRGGGRHVFGFFMVLNCKSYWYVNYTKRLDGY